MPIVNMADAWVRSVKVEKGRTVFSEPHQSVVSDAVGLAVASGGNPIDTPTLPEVGLGEGEG
ncbi:MAG TPA: hypothetical protein DD435_09050 [Cyanobacteria bacterium UBA8530]|nr:hypothetical protein [Cyanobacteria bacterium UBA8530]